MTLILGSARRRTKVWLIAIAVAGIGFETQSGAWTPGEGIPVEILQDYVGSCPAEIVAMRQYLQGIGIPPKLDPNQFGVLSDTITTIHLPGHMQHEGLATADELRILETTVFSRESDSDPRQTQIRLALRQCAIRVAYRHLPGGAGSSPPPATPPPAPVAPLPTFNGALAAFWAGNHVEAVRQWRLLADGGDRNSAYWLGIAYDNGYPGVSRDVALADHYYAIAANAGLPAAEANYGAFLMRAGRREQGLQWIARAEQRNDAEAQWVLADLYWRRAEVGRDLPRAHALMQRSAAQNYGGAVRDLPALEAAMTAEARDRVAAQAASQPAADPTADMIPEVAAAYRATTDAAIRERIVRNAVRYAASRPSLVVRANSGSGCIRPDMTDIRFDAGTETWSADIRLTNSCGTAQFGFAEDRLPNGFPASMPITNVGMYPGRWDRRRDPNVGFRPHNPDGDAPRYRLSAGAAAGSNGGIYPADGRSNQVEIWIGSCPSHAAGNVTQIGFRPSANLRDDPRIACVPGIQGPDGY